MLGTLTNTTLNYARQASGMAKGAVYGAHKYVGGGFGGLLKLGMGGLVVGSTMMTDGKEYGMGFGAVKGLAYMTPYLGGAMMAYDLSTAALEYGNEVYKKNRKLEMFSPVADMWGHSRSMLSRSISNLDRGRAILGSEAQLMR